MPTGIDSMLPNRSPRLSFLPRDVRLTPAGIDNMLANGWFRSGLEVHSNYVRWVENQDRSCQMLRLPLKDFTWKKRLAELMRRNGRLFQVKIRPFTFSLEKERVWCKYKNQVHHFAKPLPLHFLLFGEENVSPRIFNSWEVVVYHGENLAAFSIFDRGHKSIASLEAAYDPAYRQFTLGIYTMLLEIEFGIKEGMAYYYPGFIPKDVPKFEYKLRPGNLEFFRLREKKWLPWESLTPDDWLYDEMVGRLNCLQSRLAAWV